MRKTPLQLLVQERTGRVVEELLRELYVERRHTDQEIAALLQGGLSEDEVLDLVLCTAMGAGRARLEAGLRALGKEVR